MKKLITKSTWAVLAAAALSFNACSSDDGGITDDTGDNTNNSNTLVVTSNISENTTWETGKTYQLAGRISVLDGVTLTIQPGVIVKGEAGLGANATALLVARGATLNANGTASQPIIFTSVADEISSANLQAGNFASPNLAPTQNGLWGGLIVLGKAPISASNEGSDLSEVQIEGIPSSDANGLYGGNDPADNSGTIRYVSIRHGGTNIGSGNEINGLTLGGVGSGTTIEHVEVVANQDDGIEWFGGTVNVSNAVVWNVGDDAIDTDQAWSGTLDNFVVVSPDDHCFELDGPEGSATGSHTIKNGWVIANSDDITSSFLVDVDSNSGVTLENIVFTSIANGQLLDEGNNVNAAGVAFSNVFFDVSDLTSLTETGVATPAGVMIGDAANATVDTSGLTWTWASQAGAF